MSPDEFISLHIFSQNQFNMLPHLPILKSMLCTGYKYLGAFGAGVRVSLDHEDMVYTYWRTEVYCNCIISYVTVQNIGSPPYITSLASHVTPK